MLTNTEIYDCIRDCLQLKITAAEFVEAIKANPEIVDAIRSKLPFEHEPHDNIWSQYPIEVEALVVCDFDLFHILTKGYYSLASTLTCAQGYKLLFDLFHVDFPDVTYSSYYEQIELLAIDTVPEIIDSPEAASAIMEVIEKSFGIKTGQKKFIRDELKKLFHLEKGAKRPQWIQSSLWPLDANGEPMEFISQTREGDRVNYKFYSPTLKEYRVVDDFY